MKIVVEMQGILENKFSFFKDCGFFKMSLFTMSMTNSENLKKKVFILIKNWYCLPFSFGQKYLGTIFEKYGIQNLKKSFDYFFLSLRPPPEISICKPLLPFSYLGVCKSWMF